MAGAFGLVVPAEIMQVSYAAELRAFLVDEFAELTVVTFKRLVFHGILQEVVLLLGTRGRGPAQIKVAEVEDAMDLPTPETLTSLPHAPALRHEREKWTKYFLDPAEISALRAVREQNLLPRLGELADVDVGIVTWGRNQFFVMRPSMGVARGVEKHLRPLVSKSAHLRGIRFGRRDLAVLEREDALCRLLAIEDTTALDAEDALRAYIEDGEAEAVHEGYKCSIRKQWWVVPSKSGHPTRFFSAKSTTIRASLRTSQVSPRPTRSIAFVCFNHSGNQAGGRIGQLGHVRVLRDHGSQLRRRRT